MGNDLLTAPDVSGFYRPDIATTESTNRLLLALIREVQKAHPSQRCVVALDYTNALKILDSGADSVFCRFLSSGKPVLAQYLTICNNTAEIVNVGLNEPVSLNAAGTFGSGIKIAAGGTFQIPVEIEKISIRLIENTTGKGITVNNSPTGVPANGVISVYGWTVPNSDKDDSE